MDIFTLFMMQIHLLIGGTTGAGKSTVIRGILAAIFSRHPSAVQVVLIDPKRVELHPYRHAPHVIGYADTPESMADEIAAAVDIMENRIESMQAAGIRDTDEPHIYIIIDELADMMDVCPADTRRHLKRLLQLGRAAGIHIIAATQHPARKILPAELQVNFTALLALPCRSSMESRQIIGIPGAESLAVGTGLYSDPQHRQPRRVKIPLTSDADIAAALARWQQDAPPETPEPQPAAPADTAKPTKKRGFLATLIKNLLYPDF